MEEKTILNGKYFLQKKFARGSFCAVYTAMNLDHPAQNGIGDISDSQVAIKTNARGTDHSLLQWESKVLQSLENCPCVPKFYEFFQHDGKDVMVTELLKGDDLRETRIRQNCQAGTGMPLDISVGFALEMLRCLRAFHEGGYVHRDVKAANFVRRSRNFENNELCLVDFGLAKQLFIPGKKISRERPTAEFRGTTTYCSLFVHDERDQCRRDDLIAMMYVFIDLLRGSLPWSEIREDKTETKRLKSQYMNEPFFKTSGYNECISTIMNNLSSLKWEDIPDYNLIKSSLERMQTIIPHADEVSKFEFNWELPPPTLRSAPILIRKKVNGIGKKRKHDELKVLEEEDMDELQRCKRWCRFTESVLLQEQLALKDLEKGQNLMSKPMHIVERIFKVACNNNEFFQTPGLDGEEWYRVQELIYNLEEIFPYKDG